MILLLICLMKFAIILVLSLAFSLRMGRACLIVVLLKMTEPAKILHSGEFCINKLTLMYTFSTLMLLIVHLAFIIMSSRRGGLMIKGCVMWRWAVFHH